MSFEAAATVVIRERTAELTDKARHDWNQSLRNHVYPSIGTMPVSDVDSPHIRAILMALAARRATMHNVSNRISRILQWAIVMGPPREDGHREAGPRIHTQVLRRQDCQPFGQVASP